MISFWEEQSMLDTDIAIIGGGIVGLSIAASIREKHPSRQVTVFERSVLPYGASTRNAGFACFGSLTEILSDIDLMGESLAQSLVYQRWRGLQITRQRLGDDRIGFENAGGYELLPLEAASAVEQREYVNRIVADFIPGYIYESSDRMNALGLAGDMGTHLVGMKGEGQVHTGKLMKALEDYVLQRGTVLRTGAQVRSLERVQDHFVIEVSDASRTSVPFRANTVIVSTNAFARTLLPQVDVTPGRGQVFISKAIPGLKFRGNLHMDQGYYYLRNVSDRLLFGGARNLDFEAEQSTDFGLNDKIQAHLETVLRGLMPEIRVEVEQRWAGIMAFGRDKLPIVREIEPGLFCACKMSGMGIALAGFIGEEIAGLI